MVRPVSPKTTSSFVGCAIAGPISVVMLSGTKVRLILPLGLEGKKKRRENRKIRHHTSMSKEKRRSARLADLPHTNAKAALIRREGAHS